MLPDILLFIHETWRGVLALGDTALDMTMGGGRDTVTLARLVGEKGRVLAFDIQDAALSQTKKLLRDAGPLNQVTLIKKSHVQVAEYIETAPKVIAFNLGYLPGGDKTVTTMTEETLTALKAALSMLKRGGVITLALYPGHFEGKKESLAVETLVSTLPQRSFQVLRYQFLNRAATAPYAIVIEKIK